MQNRRRTSLPPSFPDRNGPRILVIHGHDTENVTRLDNAIMREYMITPVILQNLPGGGRTIIEKFEQEAKHAVYAIALLTPDDFVESKDEKYRQARPNVTFELGWVYGRLKRSRVCILVKRGTELPSDLAGINRIDFEEDVLDTIPKLQKELESAGVLTKRNGR